LDRFMSGLNQLRIKMYRNQSGMFSLINL